MKLHIYNSLTKEKDLFVVENNLVKLYICGPTVYDKSHLGHARVYVIFDIIRNILENVFGYNVLYQMNITDIDDKILNLSDNDLNKANDISKKYEDEFFKDLRNLDVKYPDYITRVTEHVDTIIEYIETIMENGYAYKDKDGSIYFNIQKFSKDYKYDLLRINDSDGKDFALWKSNNVGYDSPFGKGRPGWHIECSSMASKILGNNITIHGGGIDLEFPHHNNELAQSNAYYKNKDCDWVKYFMHVGHLHIDGLKMSKSLKNFKTIQEMLEKYTSRQIRLLFILNNIWSSPMYFNVDTSMDSIVNVDKSIENFINNTQPKNNYNTVINLTQNDLELNEYLNDTLIKINDAYCDSFNISLVLTLIQNLINKTNTYMNNNNFNNELVIKVRENVLKHLNIFRLNYVEQNDLIQNDLLQIIMNTREKLRTFAKDNKVNKLYSVTDDIRKQLSEMNIIINDN